MKFLHISDLHLGKKLMDIDMIEDQKFILDKVLMIAKEKKIDGILLSGDIYDVSVPRIEATELLDDFLTKLNKNNIKVFMISGNHDQVERLSFGSEIMKNSNIFISQKYNQDMKPIVLKDDFGEINIYLLPYIKPINIKTEFSIEENISYDEAVKKAIETFDVDYKKRNIILSHQFITGSKSCDSESYQVGGTDQISSSYYEKFDYVALGHLHMPQKVNKKEYIRYSGSPIKLSFSEVGVDKVCYLVDIKEKGNVVIEDIKLNPLKDMSVIKGKYKDLIEDKELIEKNKNNYLKVELTDEIDEPFVKEKLSIKYPNIMQVVYAKKKKNSNVIDADSVDLNKKTDMELIYDFYKEQTGRQMTKKQEEYIKEAFDEREEY